MLRRVDSDRQTVILLGVWVLFSYESTDVGMRNVAVVAVTDAGVACRRAAEVFELTPKYVSMLRGRARAEGSAGLVRCHDRPPKLSDRQAARTRTRAGQGVSQREIAARSVISELEARYGAIAARNELDIAAFGQGGFGNEAVTIEDDSVPAGDPVVGQDPGEAPDTVPERAPAVLAWVGTGSCWSGYAGAMLLHSYRHRVSAEKVYATLAGARARHYDDLAILTTATLGFALNVGTMEGFKHARRSELGPAAGVETVPELATLRARLAALAEGSDPLALQRAFAAGMLATDPAGNPVYFFDEHFVPYAGARPFAKGWNTKRRHAQPGIEDTFLVDARGRAVVFGSGEPTSLASTLPGVMTQLRQVIGPDARILLGFDRGGVFPRAFAACREAGADWFTYRRAPLAETEVAPTTSTTIRGGQEVSVELADEMDPCVSQARQVSFFPPSHQRLIISDTEILRLRHSVETVRGLDTPHMCSAKSWRGVVRSKVPLLRLACE